MGTHHFLKSGTVHQKRNKKTIKVCFASSSGGHFEQLMMLQPLMEKYDSFILTEETYYQVHAGGVRMYLMKKVIPIDRFYHFWSFVNAAHSFLIFLKERPDAVISTGVMVTVPMCIYAKLFGRKVIYIESFAKVSSPTKTGRFLYRFADRFYVQWESMLEVYPKARYLGGIY